MLPRGWASEIRMRLTGVRFEATDEMGCWGAADGAGVMVGIGQ